MKPFLFYLTLLISLNLHCQNFAHKSDSIPLYLNSQNTIFIKGIFNSTDTLNLNFDTGTTELIFTKKTIENKLSSPPTLYTTPYSLTIGKTTYKTKLYDAELSGHGTDGRFGWDLFKGKVVELNYELELLIVHSSLPSLISRDKKFTQLPISYWEDLFFIECTINQTNIKNTGLFLFDTGYQRTLMLDKDILLEERFPITKMDTIKKMIMKGAQGNEIPVITMNLNRFKIGNHTLKKVPIQLITDHKPIKDKNTHIIGNEVLKRFTIILDFQSNVVYLKPNHLFDENYIEQRKNTAKKLN